MNPFALLRKWQDLAARDRRALSAGAMVLVPVVFWLGLAQPYRAALEQARTELDAERALLAREEGLLANAGELPGRLETATQRFEYEAAGLLRVESALQAEAQLSDIVEEMAGRSRVLIQEVRSVDDQTVPLASGLEVVRLAFRAESDLQGLATLLNRLEGGSTLIRVIELSVEPSRAARQAGPDMGALSMGAIVEAYWYPSTGLSAGPMDVVNTRLSGIPQ